MGNPPAVIIVVRHGARLDAADLKWHLTSPTPYDPPLTYGGWSQSKALGARIGNILRNRESTEESRDVIASPFGKKDRGKRKHKIVIHTSPFLRCIQTSIAISAGLAQNHNPQTSPTKHVIASETMKPMHSSPLMRPIAMGSSALSPIPEPASAPEQRLIFEQHQKIRRSTLRIDAFLGEWLTPDYFDSITPPPSSVVMVTGAKADLLRREDYSHLIQMRDSKANQLFPGGWGNSFAARDAGGESDKDEDGPLSNLTCLGMALNARDRKGTRERTSSLISSGSHGSRHRVNAVRAESLDARGTCGTYQPPIPSYAISNVDPIPSGYVSHARDACIEVDYQWDSMREPQNWGKGGEYGEEWSSMHKRFRAGLEDLVGWYQRSDGLNKIATRNRSNSLNILSPEVEAAHEDTDLVVILVTHGAGCNALIGALTNQPVLLDVGMASLTMAIRKPTRLPTTVESSPETSDSHLIMSEKYSTVSDQYDVKLVANSEHLRSSTNSTPSSSRAPSVSGLSRSQERLGSYDAPDFNRSRSHNSCLGSIRRAASVSGPRGVRLPCVPPRLNSTGLWSAPRYCEDVEEDDIILNFGVSDNFHTNTKKASVREITSVNFSNNKTMNLLSKNIGSADDGKNVGLWGNPALSNTTDKTRETENI